MAKFYCLLLCVKYAVNFPHCIYFYIEISNLYFHRFFSTRYQGKYNVMKNYCTLDLFRYLIYNIQTCPSICVPSFLPSLLPIIFLVAPYFATNLNTLWEKKNFYWPNRVGDMKFIHKLNHIIKNIYNVSLFIVIRDRNLTQLPSNHWKRKLLI